MAPRLREHYERYVDDSGALDWPTFLYHVNEDFRKILHPPSKKVEGVVAAQQAARSSHFGELSFGYGISGEMACWAEENQHYPNFTHPRLRKILDWCVFCVLWNCLAGIIRQRAWISCIRREFECWDQNLCVANAQVYQSGMARFISQRVARIGPLLASATCASQNSRNAALASRSSNGISSWTV